MNLHKFINTQDDKSFNNIKNIFTNTPYFLIIKEDSIYPDLYMLCYDRDKSDLTIPFVQECRGIILEKETNKIVCHILPKMIQLNLQDDNLELKIKDAIEYNKPIEYTNNYEWVQ